jgi:hypothetical protein
MFLTTKKPYWRTHETWVCPEHLPAAKLHSNITQCYFSNCKSNKPSEIDRPDRQAKSHSDITKQISQMMKDATTCSMAGCDEPIQPKRKKYCSDRCRKRYARKQYTLRLKAKAQREGRK